MADEVARFVSPVISFVRTATEDTEVHGQRIAAGEKLILLYSRPTGTRTSSTAPTSST
jgi:cholest-4-en-3-one 26-monooxygenase